MTNTKPQKTLLALNLLNDSLVWLVRRVYELKRAVCCSRNVLLQSTLKGGEKKSKLPPFYYPNVTLKSSAESEINWLRGLEVSNYRPTQTRSSRELRLLKEQQRTHTHDFTTAFLTNEWVCDAACCPPTTALVSLLTRICYSASLTAPQNSNMYEELGIYLSNMRKEAWFYLLAIG